MAEILTSGTRYEEILAWFGPVPRGFRASRSPCWIQLAAVMGRTRRPFGIKIFFSRTDRVCP
jgi:hypothetical protein